MRQVAIALAVGLVAGLAPQFAVAAERPLPLHPTQPGAVTASPVSVERGRFAVNGAPAGRIVVRDDATGRRYDVPTPRVPDRSWTGCSVVDARPMEALLDCFPNNDPAILNLNTGGAVAPPSASAFPQGPYGQLIRGAGSDDVYDRLGSRWLAGGAPDAAFKGQVAVFLNRDTYQRVERSSADSFDVDDASLRRATPPAPACTGPGRGSANVAPSARSWLWLRQTKRDPVGDLVLMRCGKPAQILSTCPNGCGQAVLTKRVAAWAMPDSVVSGATEIVVRARRSGRIFRIRVQSDTLELAATDRRIVASVEQPRGIRGRYRSFSIPLPASLR